MGFRHEDTLLVAEPPVGKDSDRRKRVNDQGWVPSI